MYSTVASLLRLGPQLTDLSGVYTGLHDSLSAAWIYSNNTFSRLILQIVGCYERTLIEGEYAFGLDNLSYVDPLLCMIKVFNGVFSEI